MDNTNYDSKHTGPEIDAAIDRAKSGGEIDALLQSKADASSVYTKTESNALLANKADASAPDSYLLTTGSGFSSGNSYYSKNQFNQVVVHLKTRADAGTLQGYYSWVQIGTLPSGFRPSGNLFFPAAIDNTDAGKSLQGYVLISASGNVSIRAEKSDSYTADISSFAVFYAAS